MNVELVGGPLDGAHIAVRDDSRFYRIAMPSRLDVSAFAKLLPWQQSILDRITFVEATYAPDTEADAALGRWHWHQPSEWGKLW